MDRLSRLLALGDRLQSRGITMPYMPPPAGAPGAEAGDGTGAGPSAGVEDPGGRSPWLLHALMHDPAVGSAPAVAEFMARLASAFVDAHGGADPR